MGPPEPVVVEQPPNLWVTRDQPRWIAHLGSHTVDSALSLQLVQPRRDLQRMCLLERQLQRGPHSASRLASHLYKTT
jgi:hypothetical protein